LQGFRTQEAIKFKQTTPVAKRERRRSQVIKQQMDMWVN